jgi:hypothetical protein
MPASVPLLQSVISCASVMDSNHISPLDFVGVTGAANNSYYAVDNQAIFIGKIQSTQSRLTQVLDCIDFSLICHSIGGSACAIISAR